MAQVAEQFLSKVSPMRAKSWRVVATVNPTRFTAATALAATTPYVVVPLVNSLVGFSQTPVARIVQPAPGAFSIRLKLEGYDQFGAWQREVSPIIPVNAKTNTYVYFSRVYSRVTSFSYAECTPTGGATISLGLNGDPRKTVDAANDHYATRNHGWGSPIRLKPNPGWNVLVADISAADASVRDQLVGVCAMNQTAAYESWNFKSGAAETGANVAGWPGTDHKVGITDWSQIETMLGGAPTYSIGDALIFDFTVRSQR